MSQHPSPSKLSPREIRETVRKRYAEATTKTGQSSSSCYEPSSSNNNGCCGTSSPQTDTADTATSSSSSCCESESELNSLSKSLGYTQEELASVAEGANLGLGCGNPNAIANMAKEEVVLDLGSGAGFDCFLAAQAVGEAGRVIGVDMTPEMVEQARENRDINGLGNVEFRLGEIENLPVSDESVDVIISNCVINLSPQKQRVFDEAFRVLRPGGRLAISDVVMTADIPASTKSDPESIAQCIAGASTISTLNEIIDNSGFEDVSIKPKDDSREFIQDWSPEIDLSDYIVSAVIEGKKPVGEN